VPSPTPTPRTHIVARGEDLFGIALLYGLTLDELKAANPDVNPAFLSVGAQLVIPPGALPAPTATNPTATPSPLVLSAPNCLPSADGGLTCFLLASNPGEETLENPAALVRLAFDNGERREGEAFALLNLLPAAQSLPLAVFFAPPLPDSPHLAAAEPLAAYPYRSGDQRYRSLVLSETSSDLTGSIATVRARVDAPDGAGQAWVLVWGLDAQGRVLALRRWEAPVPLGSGESAQLSLTLFSLGGPIAEVRLLAEARP
jgi:hypothetical protein